MNCQSSNTHNFHFQVASSATVETHQSSISTPMGNLQVLSENKHWPMHCPSILHVCCRFASWQPLLLNDTIQCPFQPHHPSVPLSCHLFSLISFLAFHMLTNTDASPFAHKHRHFSLQPTEQTSCSSPKKTTTTTMAANLTRKTTPTVAHAPSSTTQQATSQGFLTVKASLLKIKKRQWSGSLSSWLFATSKPSIDAKM